VHYEDKRFIQPAAPAKSVSETRTFATPGIYRYHCDSTVRHGRRCYADATGALPPDARIKANPSSAVTGQVVMFNASTSRAGDSPIAKYE